MCVVRNLITNGSETVFKRNAAIVNDTVSIVDGIDLFYCKIVAAQANKIKSAKLCGFASHGNIRWNVLCCARAASQHNETAHMTKLMNHDASADNGIVVNNYFSCNFGSISDNAFVSEIDVMSDVNTFHEEIVVANNCFSFCCCATIDGDIFTNLVIIAYLGRRFFAPEFQILGNGADNGTWK